MNYMKKIRKTRLMCVFFLFAGLVIFLIISGKMVKRNQPFLRGMLGQINKISLEIYMPMLYELQQSRADGTADRFPDTLLEEIVPLLPFVAGNYEMPETYMQDNDAYRKLIPENDDTDYFALMQEENEKESASVKQTDTYLPKEQEKKEDSTEPLQEDISENDVLAPETEEKKVAEYDMNALQDYDELVKMCYVIDENTRADSSFLDASQFMDKTFHVSKETEEPTVLIYHTHSQETFVSAEEGDTDTTVVDVGERLAELLTQKGYNVLHDTTAFDLESRDYAYSNALPYIEKLLDEHASIQVVIDLHRDEMREDVHLVSNVDGVPCARYMFFNGMSCLRKSGEIAYLENPNLKDNLAFSFQLQKASNEYYPGLSRKIYLKAYRYNLHLRPASVLIELGAQNNTTEEAMNACVPLSHVIDEVLSGT